MERIRLNLEGVTLRDEKGRVTAAFRYRTRSGIVVNLPESVDVTITWDHIQACAVDLRSGELFIRLKPGMAERHSWLHGSHELRGEWIDRVELEEPP